MNEEKLLFLSKTDGEGYVRFEHIAEVKKGSANFASVRLLGESEFIEVKAGVSELLKDWIDLYDSDLHSGK